MQTCQQMRECCDGLNPSTPHSHTHAHTLTKRQFRVQVNLMVLFKIFKIPSNISIKTKKIFGDTDTPRICLHRFVKVYHIYVHVCFMQM